jgi:hypothetical protein
MTSTSRITDAGQKKWKPATRGRRSSLTASAISVIDSPEVFDVRIA